MCVCVCAVDLEQPQVTSPNLLYQGCANVVVADIAVTPAASIHGCSAEGEQVTFPPYDPTLYLRADHRHTNSGVRLL